MKCPYCDYAVPDNQLRCPNCRNALTTWKNYDQFAEASYQAGVQADDEDRPNNAVDYFLRAVVFNPDDPRYLGALGRMLVKMSRLDEARVLLKRMENLVETNSTEASLQAAADLRKWLNRPSKDESHNSEVEGATDDQPAAALDTAAVLDEVSPQAPQPEDSATP